MRRRADAVHRRVLSVVPWATMSCPFPDCCHVRHLTELDEEIESRAAAAVGTVLDRKWRLDRLLGCGGMGAVYAATHRNGTRAAVKVLLPEAAISPVLRRRFLREGYVANKVEHEGAVSIVDDDID